MHHYVIERGRAWQVETEEEEGKEDLDEETQRRVDEEAFRRAMERDKLPKIEDHAAMI